MKEEVIKKRYFCPEAAEALGMKAVQAVWYLKEGTTQPTQRKEEFEHAETLMDIIDFI